MSAARAMLVDTATSLFASIDPAEGFAAGWGRVVDAGFPLLLVPEAAGGFGGDTGDLFAVMRVAGAAALALPVGETIVTVALTAATAPRDGAFAFADTHAGTLHRGRYTGVVSAVPWGRDISAVAVTVGDRLLLIDTRDAEVTHGHSLAGEPRDALRFDAAAAAPGPARDDLRAWGAFLRVAQSAGALDRALMMSIEHANTRHQFGGPLSRLQAVQQSLAVFAVETAAVDSAGQAAAAALDQGEASFEIAAAKLRTNQAIGVGAAIAHQVHGGIGFSRDYPLHMLTRRLMGWRSEFGSDAYWADVLGARAAALGGAGLWAEITRRGDRS